MAGKRRASSELNYDRKDEPYEVEDAGTFQKATEESLKKRVIKTAKRRNPISSVRDNGDSENKSAFTGLMFSTAPPPTSNAFSFLSNLTASNTPPKTNGVSESTNKTVPDLKEKCTASTSSTNTISFGNTNRIFATNASNTSKSIEGKSDNYYSKLKGLNESVSNWIKKHVDANPLINLQPIFKDYERYFSELELENDMETTSDTSKTISTEKDKPVSTTSTFAFKSSQNTTADTSKSTINTEKDKPVSTISTFVFKSSQNTTSDTSKSTINTEKDKPVSTVSSFVFNSSQNTTSDTSKSIINTEKDKPFSTTSTFVFKAAENIPDSTTGKINSEPPKTSIEEPIPAKFSFASSQGSISTNASKPTFGFANMSTSKSFSLGTPNASTSTTPASISSSFSFGSKYPSTMSTFSSATPFTFANVTKPPSNEEATKETDDNYEPPKNDFKPVEESDHIFKIRCKVFVKNNDKFGDRGVGHLYLKTIENSEKVQLIVRADTNLGNLLCNFILSESIPTKRLGAKDVMLVCLPTPDFKPPPVPMLLRVKTSEEADKLLEVLEKHKQ